MITKVYEQLPLNGTSGDYKECREKLEGIGLLEQAIEAFYDANKQYNPRQLHYLVSAESMDVQLIKLLGI